jgi:phospholipid/cholesterol/gamma-HCH transport system permease protein
VLDAPLRSLSLEGAQDVEIDGSGISRMDSVGAWLLVRTERELTDKGAAIGAVRVPASYRPLLQTLEHEPKDLMPPPRQKHPLTDFLAGIGEGAMDVLDETYQLVGFLGRLTVETVEAFCAPIGSFPGRRLSPRSSRPGWPRSPSLPFCRFCWE